jgi:RNA polymerase sigma factor (sigma-70 family)
MENMTQTDALAQFDDAVYKYAHQWMRYPSIRIDFDLEDLAQIGRIYILKALEDYDPEAGMTLSTYIITRIRWGLNTSLRSSMPRAKRETVHFSIDDPSFAPLGVSRSDHWHPHTEPEPETFQSMTEGLSDAAQYILELRFEDDLTLAEIGAKVGKSHEWVRQFINKTISNMEA